MKLLGNGAQLMVYVLVFLMLHAKGDRLRLYRSIFKIGTNEIGKTLT
jgi:hypothetical protein